MQQWEYLIVEIETPDHGRDRVRTVNHRELPDWEHGQDLADHFDQFGAEGWELASDTYYPAPTGGTGGWETMIFKRPKPEAPHATADPPA